MTINPCCIPLKTGVRMVTHLSMALALCVGWAGLKLISISWEVSSTLGTDPSTTFVMPRGGPGLGWGYDYNSHSLFPSPPVVQEENVDRDQFRIPYEYFLYQKWHQQQMRQNGGGHGVHYGGDISSFPRSPYYPDGFLVEQERQSLDEKGPPVRPLPPPPPPLASEDEHDDEDKQRKLFRSVLLHRKNFKEAGEVPAEEDVARAASLLHKLPQDLSSPVLPVEQETSPDYRANHNASPDHDATQPRHQQLKPEMSGMMMMRGNSQKGRDQGKDEKRRLTQFYEQYAKVLLISGLLAVCTVVFQFLTSFLLLCFVDKGSNAAAQIWTAVHCSVIFCLATCLVLFLCEGLSIPKYSFDETLYLCMVTVDSLLSIYFLWVVMAFI